MTRHALPRPYPFGPLETGDTAKELALRLGISRRMVLRYRRDGLTVDQADRFAIALNVHPAQLWPTWVDDHLTILDHMFITRGGWRDDWLHQERTRTA